MPSKQHHHLEVQEYETQDGQPRQLYNVGFPDWKQTARRFFCGDNLIFSLKEQDRCLCRNAQHFDFDREQQEHERKHLTFAQ